MGKYNRLAKPRDIIIGFDETNNGLGLPAKNPNYTRSMIVTGYMMMDPGIVPVKSERLEGKGWAFGPRRNKKAIGEAQGYLNTHPHFLYTQITEGMIDSKPMSVLKAEAVARLTFEFMKRSSLLNKDSFHIVTDEFDGPTNCDRAHDFLEAYLGHARIDVPHTFQAKAEKKYDAVRKADMVGYCLAGIHLYGDSQSWPRRNKMVSTRALEELTRDIKSEMHDKRVATK